MSEEKIMSKEYLTVKEVQEYLSISQSKAYELSHRRDFPVCRLGGAIRIPRAAFLKWVQMHTYLPNGLSVHVA